MSIRLKSLRGPSISLPKFSETMKYMTPRRIPLGRPRRALGPGACGAIRPSGAARPPSWNSPQSHIFHSLLEFWQGYGGSSQGFEPNTHSSPPREMDLHYYTPRMGQYEEVINHIFLIFPYFPHFSIFSPFFHIFPIFAIFSSYLPYFPHLALIFGV